SERTKAALAQSKKPLGAKNPKIKATLAGKQGKYKRPPSKLLATYSQQHAIIQSLLSCGKTYRQIADYLNQQGHRSSKGNPFSTNLVHRIIKCASSLSSPTSTTSTLATNQDKFAIRNAR